MDYEIKTIEREELKAKLDRGDDFKLIMAMHEWGFRAAHIPGSLHYNLDRIGRCQNIGNQLLLVADLKELKADPNRPASGVRHALSRATAGRG